MAQQSEALFVAEALELERPMIRKDKRAAAELRRLSAIEAQRDALLNTMKWLDRWMGHKSMLECAYKARAAIKAVEDNNT